MNYQTFQPCPELSSLIKCYWHLEVAAETNPPKQRIVPDGCMEMIFVLGDDIKRYTSETTYIIQPRAIVVGQITGPFIIQPTGYVHCFAVRFYPYGFANFMSTPFKDLENRETPLEQLFEGKATKELGKNIVSAKNTEQRITLIETFLLDKLNEKSTVDNIVKSTVDLLFATNGTAAIRTITAADLSKRRQLERKFFKQVGLSPKQLGKVIRLQSALKLLLAEKAETLTQIAYASEYYDQAHFIRDFREFTGMNPKRFLQDDEMTLSSLFYAKD